MKSRAVFVIVGVILPLLLFSEMYVNHSELNTILRMVAATNRDLVNTARMVTAVERPAPLFILHAGPGKTGTTTVQWAAAEHDDLLRKHNIYFLGSHWSKPEWELHEFFRTCYDLENTKECTDLWKTFEDTVEHHFSQGHNVFVSEEMITGFRYDEVEQQHLWNHLEPLLSKWNVRIVFTYRRFSEWIPSKYHQAFSPTGPKHNQVKRENWPGDGGRPIPAFTSFFDYMLRKEVFAFPPNVIQRWETHFPNRVQIFNMHQEGDFVENFFCHVIPEAPMLCRHLGLHDSSGSEVKNPSSHKTLHFDMLAVRAFQKGWVHKDLSRKEVTNAVQTYAKKLGLSAMTDFPLECFTQNQTDILLNYALEYESKRVPELHASPRGKEELLSKFEDSVKKGKFCSIDVFKALKDEKWKPFFEKLRPEIAKDEKKQSSETNEKKQGGSKKKQKDKQQETLLSTKAEVSVR